MANSIKFWRKKRGITQQKLAYLIGIDRPTLYKMENPNIPIDPSEELAIKISRILKVLVTDILREYKEPMKPKKCPKCKRII